MIQENNNDHPMIPVPNALRIALTETAILKSAATAIAPGEQSEWLDTTSNDEVDLCGRISYKTVTAKLGYPPYNVSIMDGYAINIDHVKHILASLKESQDQESMIGPTDVDTCEINTTNQHYSLTFDVIHKVYAGKARSIPHEFMGLTAVYVATGAVVPSSYNAVIPVEHVQDDTKHGKEIYVDLVPGDLNKKIQVFVHLLETIDRNHWIRPIGCDIPSGTLILSPGQVIEPVHVGLLMQCGICQIKVTKIPTVGVLSTGNELVKFDNDCVFLSDTVDNHGIIPDANGPILTSLLSSFRNCQSTYLGIAKDDEEDILQETLRNAIDNHDVVITTGGISMGEMDVIEKILLQLDCTLQFGRLHMKPGKPCSFFTHSVEGHMTLIFALPGNPVSAMVCTELFLRPCLNMLHQWNASVSTNNISDIVRKASVLHPEVFATLQNTVKLDTSRPEYHRVSLSHSPNQGGILFSAISTGNQRSSRLCSMNLCDGLMLLPQGIEDGKLLARTGEKYPVLILNMPVNGLFKSINMKDSVHFKSRPVTMGIIEILDRETRSDGDTFENIQNHIKNQLEGNQYLVLNTCTIADFYQLEEAIHKMVTCTDVIFIFVNSALTLSQNLELNAKLNLMISKPLPYLAHLVRIGACSRKPIAGIFENVAGMYSIGHYSSLLMTLSKNGLDGAISSIQALLIQMVDDF
jgi:molybdenum cofactor synthesis domain-containing protein